MYGPPDQIENRQANQIWRYNYLSNFHSSVEFEFTPQQRGSSPWRKTINYPSPLATYTGSPATTLSEGLPGRHTTMGVYPAGELSKLTVPLDSLSGAVDIVAQINANSATGLDARSIANLRDTVKLSGPAQGVYSADFKLQAGSYVCRVLVREAETGRTFTEAISFDVK